MLDRGKSQGKRIDERDHPVVDCKDKRACQTPPKQDGNVSNLAKAVAFLHAVLTSVQELFRSNGNRNESGLNHEDNAPAPNDGPDTRAEGADDGITAPSASGGLAPHVSEQSIQPPLIHVVDNDDEILENTPQATWFPLLKDMFWQAFRKLGARYYDELYQFNAQAAVERRKREEAREKVNPETKEEAKNRLLFERPVMGNEEVSKIHKAPEPNAPFRTDPEQIAPGKVPFRVAGREPKDFFSLLKAFLGVVFMGFDPEPENVYHHLTNNPPFGQRQLYFPSDDNYTSPLNVDAVNSPLRKKQGGFYGDARPESEEADGRVPEDRQFIQVCPSG